MLLAVDVGNTTISIGAFEGATLHGDWRLSTPSPRTPDELGLMLNVLFANQLRLDHITGVMVASVVPRLNESLHYAFRKYFDCVPTFLTHRSGLVPLEVEDPASVGADRIADCLAGYERFGGPLLVIDFGTATTFDLIGADGAFLGGAIAPEMSAASASLFQKTALLPEVELDLPESVIGRNTSDNLKAGVVLGFLDLVAGLITRFRADYGAPLRVVATGGRGRFFTQHLEQISAYEPHLTLTGLRVAWGRLQGKTEAGERG